MPLAGSTSTGFWGTVSTMTGTPRPAAWICSTSLGPLIRPWSSASTMHDVRAELADLVQRACAVGEDVEQLDRLLGVQQAADVLRDLRHVLDDQEARLVAA